MSDWSFELWNSDFSRGKIDELVQARDRSLTISLNRAGAFSMTLPLVDRVAMLIRSVVSTCVRIRRDQTHVWGGPVWTTSESTPNTLNVGCVGWLQTLEKRISKYAWGSPLSYSAIDAGTIALDLLTRSNADNTEGPNYVNPGFSQTTQPRTKSLQPFSNILTEINNLSELESGYDMVVDPSTRNLNIYDRIGQVKSNVIYEYGSAADNVSRSCDASKICNRFIAYSSVGWAQADDLISQANIGLFEEAVSLSEVRNIAILQAYANAEIAVRSEPLHFHNLEPRPIYSLSKDPRIFRDFIVGDSIYIKVNKGRMNVPRQLVRIFSATISWDDQGTERLTSLQTSLTS